MAFTYEGGNDLTGRININESRSLLASQLELERILADLEAKTKGGRADDKDILTSIEDARACLPAIADAVPTSHKNILYPERRKLYADGLAQKVFAVTELLEMILGNLGIGELLAVQPVSRTFRDTINGSQSLQRKMMQIADDDSDFHTAFEQTKFPYLVCEASAYPLDRNQQMVEEAASERGNNAYVKVEFTSNTFWLGSRCRNMLLTQPPIKEFTVCFNCCNGNGYSGLYETEGEVLHSWTGITIGDLIDCARKIEEVHLDCRYASPIYLNTQDGHVNVEVTFQGQMALREDDPLLRAARAKEEAAERRLEEARADFEMMRAWMEARERAEDRGELPLRFAEWRKTYEEERAEQETENADL